MKPVRLLIAVLVATLAFVGLAVGTASATTAEDCQAQLATLRADTVAAQTSFTNVVDFTNQVAKLDEASAKLTEGKNADAVQKLVDFQTTLTALSTAAKPKVDPATAQTLIAEAQGVIDCINAIGVDTTTSTTSTTA
jgi:hypothetical protein